MHALYTVELWNADRIGTFYRTDLKAANPRQALALALQDVERQGVAVADNVRMWVKVAGEDDVESIAFYASDIRCWLNEPGAFKVVKQSRIRGV